MDSTTHPFNREEVMAYLDGELTPERATAAAAHLEQCADCRALAADLRTLSRQMPEWQVEALPGRVEDKVMRAAAEQKRTGAPLTREESPVQSRRRVGWLMWSAALSAATLTLFVVGVSYFGAAHRGNPMRATGLSTTTPSVGPGPASNETAARRDYSADFDSKLQSAQSSRATAELKKDALNARVPGAPAAEAQGQNAQGPMIIRRASLALLTKEFESARAALENLVKAHQGYFGQLNVAEPAGAGRSLTATVRVPAGQLDGVLVELRKLGHVQQEDQTADDITRQYVDLSARLTNARETEKRLVEILRERTGKVGDVLQVEREIARTRQEIEQMDAERKMLESQVHYAAVDLRITEEYKQSLETPAPAPSLGTRINNAAVGGFRDAADLVIGLGLWLLSTVPSLVVWGALLFWPVSRLVRWARRRFFPAAATLTPVA